MDRRNVEEIAHIFHKNEPAGIYRVRGWLEYSKVLPGSCEEWIISEFLEDVVLNQSFKRCGYTVALKQPYVLARDMRFKTTMFLAQTQAKKHCGEGNIKVQRSFISYFRETAENNWSMVGKDFLNRFHSNGVLINALFDKQGRLIYTI